jgi:uncharacterized protein
MKLYLFLLSQIIFFLPNNLYALDSSEINGFFPKIEINSPGELLRDGTTKIWSSKFQYHKPVVFIHMAGRFSAFLNIRYLFDTLDKLEKRRFHLIIVINGQDVTFNAYRLAQKELAKLKRLHPYNTYIFDNSGKARTDLSLKSNNTALYVLDEINRVKFFKQGPLSSSDISTIAQFINKRPFENTDN